LICFYPQVQGWADTTQLYVSRQILTGPSRSVFCSEYQMTDKVQKFGNPKYIVIRSLQNWSFGLWVFPLRAVSRPAVRVVSRFNWKFFLLGSLSVLSYTVITDTKIMF
jgi:hypothetical protein